MSEPDQPVDAFSLSILQASPDCVRLLDLNGCVQFMNESGKRLLEITDFEKSRGRYWPDVSSTLSRSEAVKAIAEAVAGRPYGFRSYFPTAKGTPKWWDTLVAPVFAADGRTVVSLMATSRDVTVEVEMRTFLDTIIQVVPAAVFVKDARDGRYLLVNREAASAFGYPAEDMLGKSDGDFFPPDQALQFRESDLEVIRSRELQVIAEQQITTAAGDLRYFRTKKIGTYGEEGSRHLVGVSEDITGERANRLALRDALERAEAANKAKDEFLANMSHEIRTPLNGVTALADVLARSEISAVQRNLVELIQESAETLTCLLAGILDLVGVEHGTLSLHPSEFDLAEVVRAAAARSEQAARGKGLDFRIEWEASPSRAVGDSRRLGQIVEQLLANAVKFTERGEIVLRVTSTPGAGEPLRFEVRDSGIGFNEDQRTRLFAAFQQVDGSITRQYGGSGVGLALCSRLVQLMGGRIDAVATPGAGACFFVELPLLPAASLCGDADPDHPPRSDGALRVLLAEDHPTNRRIVELILHAVGADLTSVENGQLAVEEHRARAFDVILMDMQMPVMDGLTATRLIRERERADGAGRTPVICVTANALPQHVQASRDADMDLHLAKPITAGSLLDAIDAVLSAESCSRPGAGEAATA